MGNKWKHGLLQGARSQKKERKFAGSEVPSPARNRQGCAAGMVELRSRCRHLVGDYS